MEKPICSCRAWIAPQRPIGMGAGRRRRSLFCALGTLLLVASMQSTSALGSAASSHTPDTASSSPGSELVVIDTAVEDWRTLARGVPADVDIVRVAVDEDGLSAMADAVAGKNGIRAIHVISHGESGAIRLGRSRIDRKTLERRPHALRTIRASLAADADILLAACDTASGAIGRSFLDSLAGATGADVAASTDRTGSATLGANWDLEARTGEVEVSLALSGAAMEAFQGRLAIDSQVTFGFSKYDGSLGEGDPFNQTIEADGTVDQMSFTDWRIDEFNNPDFGVNMNDGGPDSVFSDPDGDSFQFLSFTTEVFCGSPMTFEVVGYEDGSPVAGATQSFNVDGTSGTIPRTVDFASVDEVRFENYSAQNSSQCLKVDNIVVDQAVTSNTQPAFANLDATVAFDEAGGTPVVIDGDAEISDAELDGVNDYAGSTLTVERTGGANPDDEFGFDTDAGAFSVSGGDLLTGGNAFASFTESGGTLTIDFSSSQAAATSALVDDVLQGITYANPADPDVVEYTLTLTFDDGDAGGALQVSDSRPVVVDPELAPISGSTTLDFTALEPELANGDAVDARIIQELLFYGFDFEDAIEDDLVASSGLRLLNATSDEDTTPNRFESDATFLLDSIDIENFSTSAQDVTVHGYRDDNLLASETFTFASEAAPQTFDMDALNTAFLAVDELRFTVSDNDAVSIDNIVVDAGNQSPTLDLDTGAGGNDHTAAFSENAHQGDAAADGVEVTGPVLVEDSDGDPETITVTLDNNQGDTGEQLYLDNGGLVGAVTGAGSGDSLTLVRHGAAPAALADTLTNVRYQNDDDTPTPTDRTITIVATDDQGATTTATSTVTVEAGNDAPTITAPGATLEPDEDIAFDLSGANEIQFADVDAGGATVEVSLSANNGTLTFGSTAGLVFDSGTNGTGSFTVSGTSFALNTALATLAYQGNADYFGADTISATVNDRGNTGTDPGDTGDADSEADSASVSLDVQPVEDDPTISSIADQTTDEDTILAGIAFTVDDAETAPGDLNLSFSAGDPSLIASHSFGGSGGNRTLDVVPAENENGATSITVTVTDSAGRTATEDFQVTIDAVNDEPTVSPAISTLDTTADEDGTVAPIEFEVDDVETSPGAIDVTASSGNQTLVPDANLSVTSGSAGERTLGITLEPDENGTANITVTLEDEDGGTHSDSFQLTVEALNDPPSISLDTNSATIDENNSGDESVAQITIEDDEEAGSDNQLALSGPDAGAFAIDGDTLDFTGDADFETKATYQVTVEVDDPDVGGTPDDSSDFTLTVKDIDDAPIFTETGPFDVSERAANGAPVGDVDANDGDGGATDADVTYAITAGNTGGAFEIDGASGEITVADASELDTASGGSFALTVKADDGASPATASITVIVGDGPAVAAPPDLVDADAADSTGLYTEVDLQRLGDATGKSDDGPLTPEPVGVETRAWLRPGTHEITWAATDSDGKRVTDEQIVEIRPRVSIGPDRTVQEGTTIEVPVELNGDPIDGATPRIDFDVVEGSATSNDFAGLGAPGSVKPVAGRFAVFGFDILDEGDDGEPPETLVIELTDTDDDTVLADRTRVTITIVEENTPPVVTLEAEQGANDPAVMIDGGTGASPVTVTAETVDATDTADMTFAWNGGATGLIDLQNDTDPATFEFDPESATAGVYEIEVTATDNGSPAEMGRSTLRLRIADTLPPLGGDDTDGDGIDDDDPGEGRSDRDGDSLPDYLDPYRDANTIHQMLGDGRGNRLETEPGLDIALGAVAFDRDAEGARVTAGEIADVLGQRDDRENVGGYFDFTIRGLPVAGESARVVIPQREPIPEEAVYRKLGAVGGWMDFIQDGRNAVASTPGAEGFCPPPDAPVYTRGLTRGDWCVRLTIEDGGPNDADGATDGQITDPGGVARGTTVDEDGVEASNEGGGALGPIALLLLLFGTARYGRVRLPGDVR